MEHRSLFILFPFGTCNLAVRGSSPFFLAQQGSHQGLVETIFSHKMELLPEMDDLTSFDFRT